MVPTTAGETAVIDSLLPAELLHELNNVLGALRSTAYLGRRLTGDGPDHRWSLDDLADRVDLLAERASTLAAALDERLRDLE